MSSRFPIGVAQMYSVPQLISPEAMEDEIVLRFRVGDVYRSKRLSLYVDDERVYSQVRRVMEPGKMEELKVKKEYFAGKTDPKIRLCIEEGV